MSEVSIKKTKVEPGRCFTTYSPPGQVDICWGKSVLPCPSKLAIAPAIQVLLQSGVKRHLWKFPHCMIFVILFLLFCWVSTVADQNSPHDGSDGGKHNLSKTSSEMLTRPLSWCPSWEPHGNSRSTHHFFSTTKIQMLSKISQTFPNIQNTNGWGEDDSGYIVPHQKKMALPGRCWESTPSRFRVWSPWGSTKGGRWRMITMWRRTRISGFKD